MTQRNLDLPNSHVRLAGLLGEVLGGPSVPITSIDEPLVTLALRRHQVGPLLYGVASSGRHQIAPELLQRLERSYLASAARRVSVIGRLDRIATEFRARNIDWMVIKGAIQAERLYADPAWRESADIDILVTPGKFQLALEALIDIGYISSNPPMPAFRLLRKPILGAVRDATLIAKDDHSCAIELHRRLFVADGARVQSLHLSAAPAMLPAPAPGPQLACYLIVHGALSFWVRLKWVVDLVPLFAKLERSDYGSILEQAARMRVENSVAASLLLLRSLFPFVALGPLEGWLARKEAETRVQRRLQRFTEMLSLENDWKSSPLDNVRMALEAHWSVFEAPSTRLRFLASAPYSSAMRRFAGALSKSDRALTVSDVPP